MLPGMLGFMGMESSTALLFPFAPGPAGSAPLEPVGQHG